MQSKKVEAGYVLRLTRGEELLETLQKFCQEFKVKSGWFTGLGGASHVKLSYYDLNKKEYITKDFSGVLEVTNITGNVAQKDGTILLHVHATISNDQYATVGGHVDHLSVGATLELFLLPFAVELTRKEDEATGLNLLVLS
jgi:predicted DNA-binding protein with PD1-like motif